MNYPQLVLKSGRERSVRNRHPWLYSGAIKTRPQAGVGDIVAICDNHGELLALGHYHPEATLACRIFAFTRKEISIDAAFWRQKLNAARAYRQQVLGSADTTGYRLIHAEGDGLPGVVLDIFGEVASLQLRTQGAIALYPIVEEFVRNELGIERLFLRTDRKEDGPGKWTVGGGNSAHFQENGLHFRADIEKGQKTGFFLDQRDNRALLREYAGGRRILNAFAYSGAFSVYALAGDAQLVHSVDISAAATALAQENVALNFAEEPRHEAIKADCFQFLKEMEPNAYDVIVLDPPAFTKHISTVKKASRGYKEINLKAFQKVTSGGYVFTFSCSQHISRDLFRKIVFGAAADAGRPVRLVATLSQGADHPVDLYHPEGEYLKGLVLQVE
ncbi:MAG: class I SAM-dependent rRNA methyltransferase [Bacteroidota bacterium]